MAVNQLLFKDLPFQPSRNQVFYIENGYDADVNNFIQSNYFDLKSVFANNGMDFYYLPYLLREHDIEAKVRYYAPYLSSQLLTTKVQSNALVPYLSDDDTRKNLQPSLVFEGNQKGGNGEVMFLQVPLSDIDFSQSKSVDDLVQWVEQILATKNITLSLVKYHHIQWDIKKMAQYSAIIIHGLLSQIQ